MNKLKFTVLLLPVFWAITGFGMMLSEIPEWDESVSYANWFYRICLPAINFLDLKLPIERLTSNGSWAIAGLIQTVVFAGIAKYMTSKK